MATTTEEAASAADTAAADGAAAPPDAPPAALQGSSGDLDFDSNEFNYPLDGQDGEGGEGDKRLDGSLKRSVLKKPGQSRSAQNSSMMLKVAFCEVHLREYGMVLGDNPAVSHGAPVQLDWEPQECHDPVHIDNYEKARSLWRAKDRRGFLLNAHKRVKILFAAGYTIDEIAKATMEMKELRQLRADSLKTQGMMTGAIMALLSGAAETTGQTVRAVTILPNALAGAGKLMVNGTVSAGTEMMGLTSKVIDGTTNAAKRTSTAVTGAATQVTKGTGQVVVGTGKLMVKGTTGLVTGTTKVVTETGKLGTDAVKKTGKLGMDAVKGTVDVTKKTSKLTMDVAKGTGNVMVGGTKSLVKGTGVLFSGTAGVIRGSGKRLSRMVSNSMDSSSHDLDDSSSHNTSNDIDCSERSRGSIFGGLGTSKKNKFSRSSLPVKSESDLPSTTDIPKPVGSLTRQRSLDSARAAAQEKGNKAHVEDELLEMQDFLTQLEGMDQNRVQEIMMEEQSQKKKHRNKSALPNIFDHMSLSPDPGKKKNRGASVKSPVKSPSNSGLIPGSLKPLKLSRKSSAPARSVLSPTLAPMAEDGADWPPTLGQDPGQQSLGFSSMHTKHAMPGKKKSSHVDV